MEEDRYGSVLRQKMKESMSEPWKATNRRVREGREFVTMFLFMVLGIVGAAIIWLALAGALQWIR